MRKILREDIARALTDQNLSWHDLQNATIFITGATGLIGTALVRVLATANEEYNLNIRIIGHGRNASKGKALCKECGIEFIGSDIRKPVPTETLPSNVDYIFHCASVTTSADMISDPVVVIATAIDGTRNMLELAVERRCKSFVYLSSMEVYGQTELFEVRENDLGYLDLSSLRSSYPESKRLCENMCAAFLKQYFVPVKIARLAQTFGAGTSKDDTRVFAQFARCAADKRDIILHTEGKSRGNYCDLYDTIRGLITIAQKGVDGEAYNIANPDACMTIKEMAELVANEICDGKVKVSVEIPDDVQKLGYAPGTGFRLNVDKLTELGWEPWHGLADMYKHMITDWQGR